MTVKNGGKERGRGDDMRMKNGEFNKCNLLIEHVDRKTLNKLNWVGGQTGFSFFYVFEGEEGFGLMFRLKF